MKGAILVAGTCSDAGKSLVTAGICRWLARQGVSVAPFKAQNMALNSAVAPDGAEIGRAQIVQAAAAGVPAEAAMNPVLIKPSGEHHSQVIVNGHPFADTDARSYQDLKHRLRDVVGDAVASLRARFDVVVCEGAGSPAEINLRAGDLANMGLARAGNLPVLVVGDIDRGGVFASFHGTLALLEPADQALVSGFLVNKFRGDLSILQPGLDDLHARTGRPTLGVLPYLDDLWMDVEDSLSLERRPELAPAPGDDTLDVAVIRLRWMSNFTDADALSGEPGVRVRFTRSASDVERADLVIVPGTKATVEDLARLRADGLDQALRRRAAAGQPLLGICGGYQLLGERIEDDVESRRGAVDGLGLLPVATRFEAEKVLTRPEAACGWLGGAPVSGYEIRHGRPVRHGGEPLFGDEGCRVGWTLGTSWHGALEGDELRRALLRRVAAARGRAFTGGTEPFAAVRERRLDRLGDLIADHADTTALHALITGGAPAGLPVLGSRLEAPCSA